MKKQLYISILNLAGVLAVASPVSVFAANTSGTQTKTVNSQALANVISKGDQEIDRRLSSLNGLNTKITAATKLTNSDKATLSNQVSTEVSGLTALKSKLDAETTIAGAHADAQSIINDYRVYALITPKIWLIKTADDQQVVEARLQTLAGKLQIRITAMQEKGKDTSALTSKLTDMQSQLAASNAISSGIESSVISLQPTDYDANHTVLSGDNTKLKTAHQDNAQAIADAKAIIAGIKGQ